MVMLWLLCGVVGWLALLAKVWQEAGEITVSEVASVLLFLAFGPLALVGFLIIATSLWLNDHGDDPVFKRRDK